MKKDPLQDVFKGIFPVRPGDAGFGRDAGHSLLARFEAALSPLIERLGENGIDVIVATVNRIAGQDIQAGLELLEKCPDILAGILPLGEQYITDVFDLSHSVIPYGAPLAVRFLETSPALLAENDFETLTKTAALACSIARIHPQAAQSLVAKSPAIIGAAGFECLHQIAAFAAQVARSSRPHSIRAVEESPDRIDRMKEAGCDVNTVPAIYRLASVIAQDDWSIATDLVDRSPFIIRNLLSEGPPSLPFTIYTRAMEASPFGAQMACAFVNTAGDLIACLGPEQAEALWQCAFAMAADHPDFACRLLVKSPGIADGLKTLMTAEQTASVYRLGMNLCATHAELGLKFLTSAVDLARKTDLNSLKIIADMTEAMARVSHAAAASFLDVAPILLEKTGMEGLSRMHTLSIEMARGSWETASRLLSRSPALIDRVGLDGLKMIGDFAALVAAESWSAAAQLLDKCPDIIDGLLKAGDASLIPRVCHLGQRILKYNARMAVSLLDRSPDIIRLSGFEGLEKLEDLAHQAGQESWTTAVSLLETSPRILERVGFEGFGRISDLARLIARQNSYGAVSLLEKSPDLIDRLLAYGDVSMVLRIYGYAVQAAGRDWILASTLMEESPSLLARIGTDGLDRVFTLISTAARDNTNIAKRLLDVSPAVIDRMGFEGLDILFQCASVIDRKDPQAALAVVEKSPLLMDRLDHAGDRTVSPAVYGLAAAVARTSVAAAVRLLEKSPELIHWAGLDGFGMIASFVENTAKEDEQKALSFLAGNSTAFSDFMENIPKGLDLKTIKPVLSTYLRALLGRRVEIAEAETVYTDGRKIYLPGRIRDFQDQEDNFRLYKVSATHQEAHLEYGSYEFDLLKIPDVVRDLQARFRLETKEGISDIEQFTRLFPEADLAQDLFNLLEDFRIETILKREYPALGKDIEAVNGHMTHKRRSPGKIINGKQRAVEMIAQSLQAGKVFDDPKDPAIPVLRKALDQSRMLQRPDADIHDSARVTSGIYTVIDHAFGEPYRTIKPLSKPLDQDRVSQNFGSFSKTSQYIQNRLQGNPSPTSHPSGPRVEAQGSARSGAAPSQTKPGSENIVQKAHQTSRRQKSFRSPAGGGKPESGGSGQDNEEAPGAHPAMEYDSPEKIERMLRALYRERGITPREIERRLESMTPNDVYMFMRTLDASLDKKTELQSERGTSLYPEWGDDLQDYRINWTRIREQTHNGTSLAFYRETADRHAGLLKKIRREFQMLKPEGFLKLKRQYDGDDIDLDAVVDFLVDRKAGISPSEKNYTLIQKRKRDIAVAFLIDMSRSTKGETMEQEKESLIIMSEALHEVGDAFAVYGFSGNNRDNVDFYRIKDFDDAYDDHAKKRISAIEDRFENRDGTAIRHTISKLRRRPERTKLLILLSDGKPVDKEYAGSYAIEDTRMALKEAQHYGIKTFCITVDKTAAEYLPRMYSHSSWTVIDDVVKLPEKITRIYRMLTA